MCHLPGENPAVATGNSPFCELNPTPATGGPGSDWGFYCMSLCNKKMDLEDYCTLYNTSISHLGHWTQF